MVCPWACCSDVRLCMRTQVTSATSVSALAPPDATIAPPGYYMLFLVSTKGTPSVAKFVSLPMGGGLTPALPPTPTPSPTPAPGPNGTLASGQSLQQVGPCPPLVALAAQALVEQESLEPCACCP